MALHAVTRYVFYTSAIHSEETRFCFVCVVGRRGCNDWSQLVRRKRSGHIIVSAQSLGCEMGRKGGGGRAEERKRARVCVCRAANQQQSEGGGGGGDSHELGWRGAKRRAAQTAW